MSESYPMLELKTQFDVSETELPEQVRLRLYRAISWFECANKHQDDLDMAFITLWVSFNSVYAIDSIDEPLSERESFKSFLKVLLKLDENEQIYACLWHNYSGFIRTLIDNKYLYAPFWQSVRLNNEHWQESFKQAKLKAHNALARQDVLTLLMVVLDRLYVLRNQLVHGGASYQSSKNRDAVNNSCNMLFEIMPILLGLMLKNPQQHWGDVHYPLLPDAF